MTHTPYPSSIDDDKTLRALGVVNITDVGSENIYFTKNGKEYCAKVHWTERFKAGEHDFSNEFVFSDPTDAEGHALLKFEYINAYGVAAGKLKALLFTVDLASFNDLTAIHTSYAALVSSCESFALEISARRDVFLERVGLKGHSDIYDSPEWTAYNDVLREYSVLKAQLQKRGLEFLVAEGKTRVAGLTPEASIEEKADAVFAAHAIPNGAQSKTVAALINKDAESLRSMLGNPANKASRALFTLVTGIRLERTAKAIYVQIDTWAGVSKAERSRIISEKQTALFEKRALKDLTYAWDALAHHTGCNGAGEIRSIQVAVLNAYHDGYTDINSYKRGVATSYWMDTSGKEGFGYPKLKAFNTFIKAALAFGGLEKSLTVLGALKPVAEPA